MGCRWLRQLWNLTQRHSWAKENKNKKRFLATSSSCVERRCYLELDCLKWLLLRFFYPKFSWTKVDAMNLPSGPLLYSVWRFWRFPEGISPCYFKLFSYLQYEPLELWQLVYKVVLHTWHQGITQLGTTQWRESKQYETNKMQTMK